MSIPIINPTAVYYFTPHEEPESGADLTADTTNITADTVIVTADATEMP